MDRVTAEQRSNNMKKIRGKNTSSEVYLRKCLFSRGYRYRICSAKVIGHPDIWIKKYNTAIFVHGCFWHQHTGCRKATIPATRTDFWKEKFHKNMARDAVVKEELQKQNIKCLVVWECTIKNMLKNEDFERDVLTRIVSFIIGDNKYLEV